MPSAVRCAVVLHCEMLRRRPFFLVEIAGMGGTASLRMGLGFRWTHPAGGCEGAGWMLSTSCGVQAVAYGVWDEAGCEGLDEGGYNAL